MRCIICRPEMQNLKTRKKLKTYLVDRTELSINENTKRPQTETMFNLLGMSEICCIV